MGRALASSKPKKNPEEDRRKRKNPKSRKRRRVSFPPPSSSSETDDVSRRRRSSRRKPEIRRGRDQKRSMKRSRKARHRSVSSTSRDSSSSCSTCRSLSSGSLNRSRSPVRGRDDGKGKLKRKVKRGRKLDRVVRSLRSRNRSLSCSTCSGSSGSGQTYSYREVKNKERDGSRQIGSSSVIESRGEVEEGNGNSKGREVDDEMIMKTYDESQFSHVNVEREVDIVKEGRVMDDGFYEQGTEIDRWMSESNVENDSYFDQGSWTQASEPYKELELNTKLSIRIKSEIVVADKRDSESDDLELMLRQKALENLKKLRGGLSSDNRTTDYTKNDLSGFESSEKPSETATKIISSPKSPSTVSKETHIQLGVPSIDSKVKPAMQSPSLEANHSTSDKKTQVSLLNQNRQSPSTVSKETHVQLGVPSIDSKVKPVIQSPSLEANYSTSDKKTLVSLLNQNKQSPCGGSQEKNASEGCGSGTNSLRSEVNLGDGKEKLREINETVDECQSGSQFEQKTFSRMHDGEMVQVSYKVYIPNKTPALARRKLQR